MKKFGSILLTLAVLLTLCAGALPVYAEDASISITSTKTVLMVGQTTYITVTAPSSATDVTIDIDNEDVLSYNDTNSTITGLKKGTAVITASCTDGSGNALTDSVTVKVRAPTGLIHNTDYYIMNCDTGKLLSLETVSDANNVNIIGRALSDKFSYSQWKVLIQSDGTTRLQSVYSTVGRALYTPGSRVILYNSTGARTKFDLHRVESGTNQGKYLIRYDNKYVSMDSTGQVYMSASLVAGSCWSFMAVEKGYADLFSFNYNYIDSQTNESGVFYTISENDDFESIFYDFGYTSTATTTVNDTADTAYEYLTSGDIFIYYGHGAPARLAFLTTNNVTTGRLYANIGLKVSGADYTQCFVSDCADNGLATQRCVLYLGCSTGVSASRGSSTFNLVDETFEKGAHFVLGLSEDSDTGYLNVWLDAFLNGIKDSQTISGAISLADQAMYNYSLTREIQYENLPTYTAGDSNQYLD